MHTWKSPRSFAFPLVEGSTGFLVTNDLAGSQPACAEERCCNSYPPHYRTALAFSSVPLPTPRQLSLRSAFLPRGEMLGLPCSARTMRDELAPVSTPAVCLSVMRHTEIRNLTACRFGWSLSASLARYT